MSKSAPDWEIAHCIRILESVGYIIRKPSEADISVVLEVEPHGERSFYDIGIRADTTINDVTYAFAQRFPVELVLNQDDASFREKTLPEIMGRELGRYIGDRLTHGLTEQVKAKIEPLVPEKQMGLNEIVSFIADALGTSKHRIEPRFYDDNDNRRPVE